MQATAAVIASKGPSAATSRAIAAQAGENLGAITYYFGSKDQLVTESLTATARSLVEPVINQLRDATIDPVTKMLTAAQMLQQFLLQHADKLAAYVHSLAAASTDPIAQHEIQQLHRHLAETLAIEMKTQQDAGILPGWIEPQAMGQLIVALVNGVAIASATDPDHNDPPAIAAQFAQLLLAVRKHT